jgi:hypothetical protein
MKVFLLMFFSLAANASENLCDFLVNSAKEKCNTLDGKDRAEFFRSSWIEQNKTDPINDKRSYMILKYAQNMDGTISNDVKLGVTCLNEKTSIFIDWGEVMPDDANVVYRLDDSPAVEQKWHTSSNHTTTRHKGKSIDMANQMLEASNMVVRSKPFSMPLITVQFDLSGYSDAASKIRRECSW